MRSLRFGRTRLFGLIISDIKNPFFPELIDAFEMLAATESIDVIFTHTDYDPKRLVNCVRRMVDRNVDGIAVMTSEVDEEALTQAEQARIPLVLLNQMGLRDRYSNIPVDYSQDSGKRLTTLCHLATATSASSPVHDLSVLHAGESRHSKPHCASAA
jgi:LacI family transcriptional regulator